MAYNKIKTELSEVLILEPKIFEDDRGFFFESFNQRVFNKFLGREVVFVQDNQSSSSKGVLRGLHFQKPPHAQAKLVSVIKGAVLDVAVDIRKESEGELVKKCVDLGIKIMWKHTVVKAEGHKKINAVIVMTVSYTHLTLPTILLV